MDKFIRAYKKNECLFDTFYTPGMKYSKYRDIIHVNRNDYLELANRLSTRRGKYVVYVEVGDSSLGDVWVPDNILKVYSCNLDVFHPKHEFFPFGILDGHFNAVRKCEKEVSRENKIFVAFNRCTFHKRGEYWDNICKLKDLVVANYPWSYTVYYENLWKYKFVACPRGNGIDTYRKYEGLHCGCIPVLLPNICNVSSPFPAIFTDMNFCLSEKSLDKQMKFLPYIDNEMLHCKFWRKKMISNFLK